MRRIQRPHVKSLEGRALLSAVVGGEPFQVNTTTAATQTWGHGTQIAADAAGNFVSVWLGFTPDGFGSRVYGQRFDAGGNKRGPEFLVDTTDNAREEEAALAVAPDGRFVVAYSSWDANVSFINVFLQRYRADGAPDGGPNQLTFAKSGWEANRQPSIATDAQGNFVVAWAGRGKGRGSTYIPYAQRFDAAGRKLGQPIAASGKVAGVDPSVDVEADGDFVVAWEESGQNGIFAQRFSAGGVKVGGQLLVNAGLITANSQLWPEVAVDDDGEFAVTWATLNTHNGNRADGVYLRRWAADAAGQLAGGPVIRVNEVADAGQTSPAIDSDADGNLLVGWTSHGADNRSAPYVQRFDAGGGRVGANLPASDPMYGGYWAQAAWLPGGAFAIGWNAHDFGTGGQELFARIFTPDTGTPTGEAPPAEPIFSGTAITGSTADGSEASTLVDLAAA